jgi:signal transduction histidine kinase
VDGIHVAVSAREFVSRIPLRLRFTLSIAGIVTVVFSALFAVEAWTGAQRGVAFWLMVGSGILAVALLVDRVAQRLIYRRLFDMRRAMQQAAAGQLSVRVPVDGLDEVGVIARGLNDILQGLERLTDAFDVNVEAAVLSEELARAGRLAALGQAAANMAHQIGTPLNLISGYVQLLIESTPPSSTSSLERLKAVQDQVAKVTAIVRAALDSARPSMSSSERIDLGALVRRVCRMAGPMVERARVEIDVDVSDGPAELIADPVQLELALLNLISNGIDAMASGGRIGVRLRRTGERIQLHVEDTGGGIAPELVGRIFDPWVTTKPPGKGSGLGLSIARQVVGSHGGSIFVENRPGMGAVFTIDLPAASPQQPQPDIAHAQHSDR